MVVAIPNLKMGSTSEKQKLRNPTEVVKEVNATGIPTL